MRAQQSEMFNSQISLIIILALVCNLDAFLIPTAPFLTRGVSRIGINHLNAEGFSKEEKTPKPKTEGALKREQERSKYEELTGTGGQEVSMF